MTTLSHKIRLQPTHHQDRYFRQACGIARFTWNWALAEWRRQYTASEKPNALALKKQFNAIKPRLYPWMYDVTKYASQQPFLFLQNAFQRFFRKESAYPRFKKKGVHDSFYMGNDHIKVEKNRIRIPKLGWVKMREHCRFLGRVVSATVSRVADKWFVSLQVALTESPSVCESQASVGVDLGILTLATLFDGKTYHQVAGPQPLKQYLRKLKREQRRLSKKQFGSNNRAKQRVIVARLHYRIVCIRQESLHQLTSALIHRYRTIVIEDLHVKGMLKNHCLARSIADMGFHEFKRQLLYKAELHGNTVVLADRYFPSSKRCSRCGEKRTELKLSDRLFECEHCGLQLNRDKNAAKNLLSTVSSTGFEACGEVSSGVHA